MLAFIYVFVWLRAYSGFQKYSIPSPSSPQISLQLPLTEMAKQYQHRRPTYQRCLHRSLRHRNHTLCHHQASPFDISDPAACQDDNMVGAFRLGGC